MIVHILIVAVSVLIAAAILPGIHIKGFLNAVIVAIVLGLLNFFVSPVMVLLSIPITILTLGLFLFVINALIIMLAAYLVNGFIVDGFWWALIFSLVLSIVSSLLDTIILPGMTQSV